MKEIVYTLPYSTEKDIHKANRLRMKLYNKYNSVQVYPSGWDQIRIIAAGKIKFDDEDKLTVESDGMNIIYNKL